MKVNTDLAITSGGSPPHDHNHGPALYAVPDDISDVDLASQIKKAVTLHGELSDTLGELLVKAHLRHPTQKAFTDFLKTAGDIKFRRAMDLIKFCLEPATLAKHKIKQAQRDKEYRARKKAEAKAGKEAIKAAKAAAAAAVKAAKPMSKAKQRAMAAGLGISAVRDLLRQVAKKFGKDAFAEILGRYNVKRVEALKSEDYEQVREDCRAMLTAYGHEVTEPPPGIMIGGVEQPNFKTYPAKVEQPRGATDQSGPAPSITLADCVMPAKPVKPITHANGFDGADSFGKDGADRNARALAGFMDECRASAFLPRLSDDGLVKAADFIMSGEWKTVEDAA